MMVLKQLQSAHGTTTHPASKQMSGVQGEGARYREYQHKEG